MTELYIFTDFVGNILWQAQLLLTPRGSQQ